jgi:hypothetical protein
MRIRSVPLLVVASLMALALPVAAAPPETITTTEQNVVATFPDVVPSCEGGGPLYEITTTSNDIEHVTLFDDGRTHATFTSAGTFVAVPLTDPSLPDASGHFAVWGGFNDNGGAVNGTFTFNVHGTFEDGSKFKNHVTEHFNVTPNGAEFFFTHCHD